MKPSLFSSLACVSVLALTGPGCAVSADEADALPPGADTQEGGMSAMERVAQFGLEEVRGMVYDPGPAPDASGKNGYKQNDKYTTYFDSDFANASYDELWSRGASGKGRDDLRRFKDELNANFITLYDWNAGDANKRVPRDHKAFFDYANELGLKATIAVSNYTMAKLCRGDMAGATTAIENTFAEMYSGTTPHPGAGMLKVFNEPDGSECSRTALVADVMAAWKRAEDARGVPDAKRLPIFFPVTYSIKNGLPGGAILDGFEAIKAHPELGEQFWRERIVVAVNPFNSGSDMHKWLTVDYPAWAAQKGIPTENPIMFTEYGRSSDEVPDRSLEEQAKWVDGQFAAIFPRPVPQMIGASAFVSQVRPWLAAPEPNFGLMDFGGDGGGHALPAQDHTVSIKYWNPNGNDGKGAIWDGAYNVQRQTPRPAYWKIAEHYVR